MTTCAQPGALLYGAKLVDPVQISFQLTHLDQDQGLSDRKFIDCFVLAGVARIAIIGGYHRGSVCAVRSFIEG